MFPNIFTKLSESNRKFENSDLDYENRYKRMLLFVEWQKINLRLEAMIKQKSKTKWTEEGDLNSKYSYSWLSGEAQGM